MHNRQFVVHIHLVLSKHPHVLRQVEDASTDEWLQALLQVHQEFLGRRWGQGKVTWLKNLQQFNKSSVWDCFGTEHHFVVSRLSTLQLMREITTCAEQHCTFPRLYKNNTVIEVVCNNFTGLQESLDEWFHPPTRNCKLINNKGLPCQGQRNIVRQDFAIGRPTLLVLRCLSVQTTRRNKLIWPNQLPENVNILGEGYIPIGMTYHQNTSAHFVSFHRVGNQGWHYYDGMKETSKPGAGVVKVNNAEVRRLMLQSWIAGHLVLVTKQKESNGADGHMEMINCDNVEEAFRKMGGDLASILNQDAEAEGVGAGLAIPIWIGLRWRDFTRPWAYSSVDLLMSSAGDVAHTLPLLLG
ncbi:hypothetical protein UPYG_G00115080 [Umbra pygmaea]|uniref:Uncharacterized protein n=1 Tax=Umbra pygmaea TaxID=75934 RepID=A0ABD0X7B3_UMBPY